MSRRNGGRPAARRIGKRTGAIALAVATAAALAAGCGSSPEPAPTTTNVEVASATTPPEGTSFQKPPEPKHLDVATKEQRANAETAKQAKAEKSHPDRPTPAEIRAAARTGDIPPASAGTNGSFDPSKSNGDRAIVPETVPATPHEAKSRAILLGRTALAPADAPEPIQAAISAANQIVGTPYIWGGGHASWYSKGYDCSGSVSYALAGAGFLDRPLTSGDLASWGAPGPGRWLTVYANGSHTYAVIAGLRWDTVGDAHGTGPRWHAESPYPHGFVARHPPGY